MKRTLLFVCAILLTHAAIAAEFGDHPLVGRYPGATITHQEVSEFGQYTALVGAEETETIQGEVWMTLYAAPGDSSTFSVYSTYLDFLEAEGFTILVSCQPGHCAGNTLTAAYDRAPFANHGNYNHSAPITHGNKAASAYISAKRETGGSTIYVSIAIAAGWYDYPQYKLDVVEVASNTASIVSTGTRGEEPVAESSSAEPTGDATQATASTPTDTGFFSNTGSFRARAGYAAFMFTDHVMHGGTVVHTDSVGTTVSVSGFRDLHGPYAEIAWFPNQNLGFVADVSAFATAETSDHIDGITYASHAQMILVRAGTVVRVVGDAFPATLGLGFGGGLSMVEFYQSWSADAGGGEWFYGEGFFPVIHCSAELTFPLISVGRLSAGLEYLYIPPCDLTFEQENGGSDYSLEYRDADLGGLVLRVGLVVEL